MAIRAELAVHLEVSESGANAFSGGPYWSAAISHMVSIADGVGAGQADLAYCAERSVATGANDDIDLAGALASALGITFASVEIAVFMLRNVPLPVAGVQGANTTNLSVSAAASNPAIAFLASGNVLGPIRPGGLILLDGSASAAGLGVITPATGDILRIVNSAGATNKYQLCVLGRTA